MSDAFFFASAPSMEGFVFLVVWREIAFAASAAPSADGVVVVAFFPSAIAADVLFPPPLERIIFVRNDATSSTCASALGTPSPVPISRMPSATSAHSRLADVFPTCLPVILNSKSFPTIALSNAETSSTLSWISQTYPYRSVAISGDSQCLTTRAFALSVASGAAFNFAVPIIFAPVGSQNPIGILAIACKDSLSSFT